MSTGLPPCISHPTTPIIYPCSACPHFLFSLDLSSISATCSRCTCTAHTLHLSSSGELEVWYLPYLKCWACDTDNFHCLLNDLPEVRCWRCKFVLDSSCVGIWKKWRRDGRVEDEGVRDDGWAEEEMKWWKEREKGVCETGVKMCVEIFSPKEKRE